jgi:hypothetical protein
MKKFVIATGIFNIGAALTFIIPGGLGPTGIAAPDNRFWLLLPAFFLLFMGIMLIFAARDLERRAVIVFWDGMLRGAAFFLFAWLGYSTGNVMPCLLGVVDLAIALAYFIGLPRVLGRDFMDILLDRR